MLILRTVKFETAPDENPEIFLRLFRPADFELLILYLQHTVFYKNIFYLQ
ncbi:Uncharacterized protein dnm_089990 [Desulfonema magnum]|uniref:Uncharacterized protein n=1 Tax=Desulfonema magnum TaxID=45655 RepID=A0A975GTB4_9BACT|nr:Uncharacterized protein dnm_089990 [Desulfonema magnum]